MKERLIQLLDMEQLSPSKFADIIGVQRSSISHVISGRNKPSFDFLQKTLKAFPGLNADWLILGNGTMYDQIGRGVSGNLFAAPAEANEAPYPGDIQEDAHPVDQITDFGPPDEGDAGAVHVDISDDTAEVSASDSPPESDSTKKVVQVMVFYDDDTFKSFKPSQ